MKPQCNAKKIRAGLWKYRKHLIELRNESAEVYPGDLDYGTWSVTADDISALILNNADRWLTTYPTLNEAKIAVDINLAAKPQ